MAWKKGKCYDDIATKARFETFSESTDPGNACSAVGKGVLWQIPSPVKKF